MIIKTDKAGKELESWPSIDEAAKAIKVSPAVLKKHLKGRPPKLGGFVFKLQDDSPATAGIPLVFKNYEKDKDGNREDLKDSVVYMPTTPESFDSPPLNKFVADEAGMFATPFVVDEMGPNPRLFNLPTNDTFRVPYSKSVPVMLDEFGDPVHPEIPEDAFGKLGIPPECYRDLFEMGMTAAHIAADGIRHVDPLSDEMLAALANARSNGDSHIEVYYVDPEQVADYLRTPLERRLHEIKKKK